MLRRPRASKAEEAAERHEEWFKRRYPHMARYYGMMHDEVLYDICKRLGEVEKWLELNTTKR